MESSRVRSLRERPTVAAGKAGVTPAKPVSVDESIRFYEDQVRARPRLYPVHVELGEAYLDKAAATHDPAWLRRSRASVDRAMALQPTFEAYLLLTRLNLYVHRFADALAWAERAANASVNGTELMDPLLVPALVEAHLGLGQEREAAALLSRPKLPEHHSVAVARGHLAAYQRKTDEAVAAFTKAADLATSEPTLVAWSLIRAAGALLDAGRGREARPFLTRAETLDPSSRFLRMHKAELQLAEGHAAEALRSYEALLAEAPDPDMHYRAFGVARKLGDDARARAHFAAAERGFERIIAAGEVYTLGSLAKLYVDARVQPRRALALAEQNLNYKRDTEARETLAAARLALAGPPAKTRLTR